jgi:hypothetical protein
MVDNLTKLGLDKSLSPRQRAVVKLKRQERDKYARATEAMLADDMGDYSSGRGFDPYNPIDNSTLSDGFGDW